MLFRSQNIAISQGMMTFPVSMQCSVDVVLEASICLYVMSFHLKKSDDDLEVCSSVIGFGFSSVQFSSPKINGVLSAKHFRTTSFIVA